MQTLHPGTSALHLTDALHVGESLPANCLTSQMGTGRPGAASPPLEKSKELPDHARERCGCMPTPWKETSNQVHPAGTKSVPLPSSCHTGKDKVGPLVPPESASEG